MKKLELIKRIDDIEGLINMSKEERTTYIKEELHHEPQSFEYSDAFMFGIIKGKLEVFRNEIKSSRN